MVHGGGVRVCERRSCDCVGGRLTIQGAFGGFARRRGGVEHGEGVDSADMAQRDAGAKETKAAWWKFEFVCYV